MRYLFFFFLLTSAIFASRLSTLYKYYEKQEYEKGCNYGARYYTQNINNEKYLTLYGLACLETDHLNRVAKPMLLLDKDKASRENASYFATILLQKQLLKQALMDQKPLGDLKLPKTNFVLSRIFDLFVAKAYKIEEDIYTLNDPEREDLSYKVYIKSGKKKKNYLIIDIYQEDRFTKRYRYN
jgi:hypothetical protein